MLGRYGELGTVVERTTSAGDDPELVVQGGVSRALIYHVPSRRILEVSDERRTVRADVDVTDFVASLRGDGTVVLDLVL